jgi:hypothetical protein
MAARDLDGLLAAPRLEHLVAALAHGPRREAAQRGIVLDDQHRLAPALQRLHRRRRGRLGSLAGAGKVGAKDGAVARLAVGEDRAARLAHDSVAGGEAEPGALPQLLGGEEGLEDVPAGLEVHSHAGVADREHHVFARRQRAGLLDELLLERDVGGLDAQPPSPGHRVARVDRQVEHHLLELAGIDLHQPERGCRAGAQLDVLADEAPQHALGLADLGVEAHHPGLDDLPPGKGEELPGQGGAAICGREDLLHVADGGIAFPHALAQVVSVAEHHRQQVVEVVRHAAGEPRDGLHLLHLDELRFDPLALLHFGGERIVGALQVGGGGLQLLLPDHRFFERLAHGQAEAVEDDHQDGVGHRGQQEDPERRRRRGPRPQAAEQVAVPGQRDGHRDDEGEEHRPERAAAQEQRAERQRNEEVLEDVAAELEAGDRDHEREDDGEPEHVEAHSPAVPAAPDQPGGHQAVDHVGGVDQRDGAPPVQRVLDGNPREPGDGAADQIAHARYSTPAFAARAIGACNFPLAAPSARCRARASAAGARRT